MKTTSALDRIAYALGDTDRTYDLSLIVVACKVAYATDGHRLAWAPADVPSGLYQRAQTPTLTRREKAFRKMNPPAGEKAPGWIKVERPEMPAVAWKKLANAKGALFRCRPVDVLDPRELRAAAERARIVVSSGSSRPMAIVHSGKEATVSAESYDCSFSQPLSLRGPSFSSCVDVRYLIDALSALGVTRTRSTPIVLRSNPEKLMLSISSPDGAEGCLIMEIKNAKIEAVRGRRAA